MRALWVWGMLLCACRAPTPERLPRIVSVSPTGTGVSPRDLVATVNFSDPIDPAGIEKGQRIVLCRAADRDQVAKLLESTDGVPAGAAVIALQMALVDGGKSVELRPTGSLDPLSGYALMVGNGLTASGHPVLDPEGRRRVFVSLFETGPAPDMEPPLARWALPPHGPVPRNLRALLVAFEEPVEGELALRSNGSARPVTPAPKLLGLELERPLDAQWLELSLSGVHDLGGNPAQDLEPLVVAACEDWTAPTLALEKTSIIPGELGFQVAAEVGELVRLGAELRSPPEQPACGLVPPFPDSLVLWGDVQPCAGADPCRSSSARCGVALTVSGLCPEQRLLLRLSAEDLAGNRPPWGTWREVATLPGQPRPIISEALIDAASPESAGEYLELANVGTASADLSGHALVKRSASGSLVRCSLEALAGAMPPGGYALVVGGAYDGRYTLPEGTALYRCGTAALLGGLANDRPPAFQLETPEGMVLSSLGMAVPSARCSERSVERIHPTGPDTAENRGCARAGIGTPGRCNSITPSEECPRRPW